MLSVLPDGDYLSRITDPAQARRLRRQGTTGADIPGIPVRVIEYSLSPGPHHPDPHHPAEAAPGELFCLATTLLDPDTYPMAEFPDRYGERWELETGIGEVETRLRGGPEVLLRSHSPDMVRQEIYALLCVYQAIRHLITTAATDTAIDPDRISFTRTVQAVRRHLSDEAAFSPLRPD